MTDFETTTASFLTWLSQQGIQVNPKISLVDLRAENKGRGVGEFSFLSSRTQLLAGSSHISKTSFTGPCLVSTLCLFYRMLT